VLTVPVALRDQASPKPQNPKTPAELMYEM